MGQSSTREVAQSRDARPPKVVIVGLILSLCAAGFLSYQLVVRASAASEQDKPLEIYGTVPSFSFRTQEGAPFTDKDMRGHPSIANFIFTRCPTICPVFTLKMQRIAEQTTAPIELLSFSVDPEYDTPERLTAYAADFSVDAKRWHFLTGDEKEVRDTVEGAFKIAMERQGNDENGVPDIVHGFHFVLFDGEGRIRGYYNSDDVERIRSLIKDANRLAKQSK